MKEVGLESTKNNYRKKISNLQIKEVPLFENKTLDMINSEENIPENVKR